MCGICSIASRFYSLLLIFRVVWRYLVAKVLAFFQPMQAIFAGIHSLQLFGVQAGMDVRTVRKEHFVNYPPHNSTRRRASPCAWNANIAKHYLTQPRAFLCVPLRWTHNGRVHKCPPQRRWCQLNFSSVCSLGKRRSINIEILVRIKKWEERKWRKKKEIVIEIK